MTRTLSTASTLATRPSLQGLATPGEGLMLQGTLEQQARDQDAAAEAADRATTEGMMSGGPDQQAWAGQHQYFHDAEPAPGMIAPQWTAFKQALVNALGSKGKVTGAPGLPTDTNPLDTVVSLKGLRG